ncbi:MAG TPA: SH3 domain-containing protein, partial [Candidatus Cloacimonetes bacterium]|nr:SH3 domain-containing protein [Candidatus Cloacimonadota bacterium]HEX38024.1 SH3 domain-containing protein [Candidatus Cloacimonadota bacterium]
MNYRKVYLLIIVAMLVIFLVIIHLFAAENVTIRREEAMLREGPGSYYPPIAILPEDLSVTVVEDGELWLKVQADEQIGYISRKVIEGKKDADDMFAQMGSERAITEISDIGMT